MKTPAQQIDTFLAASAMIAAGLVAATLTGCGSSTGTTKTSVQAAPLSGPNAAYLNRPLNFASIADQMLDGFSTAFLGVLRAHAAVSSFSRFAACNDTLILIDSQGNQIKASDGSNPSIGLGLLTFDPNGIAAMPIGSVSLNSGLTIKEADITFATVPSLCGGANYAVEFNDGIHGVIDVTQNTAFKFKFPGNGTTVSGDSQTITLMFGQIVNGMASLGATLNNSTIQTVNVGQAQ